MSFWRANATAQPYVIVKNTLNQWFNFVSGAFEDTAPGGKDISQFALLMTQETFNALTTNSWYVAVPAQLSTVTVDYEACIYQQVGGSPDVAADTFLDSKFSATTSVLSQAMVDLIAARTLGMNMCDAANCLATYNLAVGTDSLGVVIMMHTKPTAMTDGTTQVIVVPDPCDCGKTLQTVSWNSKAAYASLADAPPAIKAIGQPVYTSTCNKCPQ